MGVLDFFRDDKEKTAVEEDLVEREIGEDEQQVQAAGPIPAALHDDDDKKGKRKRKTASEQAYEQDHDEETKAAMRAAGVYVPQESEDDPTPVAELDPATGMTTWRYVDN